MCERLLEASLLFEDLKVFEFLINYIRKNPKYFTRKFYKKNFSYEVDLFEGHYFVNVAFPPLIVRERLVSLDVIDKIDNPADAFSHILDILILLYDILRL